MNTAQQIQARAARLSEDHQAEVLDFIAFLAAKEAEDRADYELAAERCQTMGKTWTLEEIEAGLDLEG